eukprot:CAMPEP_0175884734 /NCGR_PEP_ID=MMETSP0107_2-20121207/44688_1 /TAXON_ID=195067 ORGANISM="Goniomonas pacifica, Strain CCMP1869" /NCGR_SAMPLE_ID=MMETSP0107_2 /ASSEMBLY_ACC=CAM_ASM_000203 /LENGTH=33 /DNA_ID= /DNA_START= /DNA_END= /DNA_ORIENTATION=
MTCCICVDHWDEDRDQTTSASFQGWVDGSKEIG